MADGTTTDLDELLTRADLALQNAKDNGKACWSVFHAQMDIEYRQRQRLKSDFLSALEKGQLFVNYQPIVDLRTRGIVGCEALVRWRHPGIRHRLAGPVHPAGRGNGRHHGTEPLRARRQPPPNAATGRNTCPCRSICRANDFRITSVQHMVAQALEMSGLAGRRV